MTSRPPGTDPPANRFGPGDGKPCLRWHAALSSKKRAGPRRARGCPTRSSARTARKRKKCPAPSRLVVLPPQRSLAIGKRPLHLGVSHHQSKLLKRVAVFRSAAAAHGK